MPDIQPHRYDDVTTWRRTVEFDGPGGRDDRPLDLHRRLLVAVTAARARGRHGRVRGSRRRRLLATVTAAAAAGSAGCPVSFEDAGIRVDHDVEGESGVSYTVPGTRQGYEDGQVLPEPPPRETGNAPPTPGDD